MDAAARVERVIAPILGDLGYELVRVKLSGGEGQRRLQVMVERADESQMTLDDCAEISQVLSALLDVEDPVRGAYTLEVSSPGIDRPLTRRHDFVRFAGAEAKLETKAPVEGRRRFRGRLGGIDGDLVRIETAEGRVELPFDEIDNAKLVLTDELIAASLKSGRARARRGP